MYRIAVCEDDPRTAEQNKTAACRVLEGKGHVQGRDYDIDVFHTAPPLIERLAGDPDAYQLLLLDIQLDGDNGVELARFLREHQVGASIIYITDHPGFALDSFPTYPLEYLLKPIRAKTLYPILGGKDISSKNDRCCVWAVGSFLWMRSPIWRSPDERPPSTPKRGGSSTPSPFPS